MVQHLESHKLIAKEQYGFVKGRSCLTNMLETLDDITSNLDKGQELDMVFVDYRKTFDSVPHRRLLHKIKSYDFGEVYTNWITDFYPIGNKEYELEDNSRNPRTSQVGYPKARSWSLFCSFCLSMTFQR